MQRASHHKNNEFLQTDWPWWEKPPIKDELVPHLEINQPTVLNPQTAWGMTLSRLPYPSPQGWLMIIVWWLVLVWIDALINPWWFNKPIASMKEGMKWGFKCLCCGLDLTFLILVEPLGIIDWYQHYSWQQTKFDSACTRRWLTLLVCLCSVPCRPAVSGGDRRQGASMWLLAHVHCHSIESRPQEWRRGGGRPAKAIQRGTKHKEEKSLECKNLYHLIFFFPLLTTVYLIIVNLDI